MEIISIISAIGGIIGVISGASALFYVRQEREKRELENDSQIIEQYKSLANSQEKEHQRLLMVIDRRNAKVDALEKDRDKYLELWLSERCVVKTCSFRKPPVKSDAPQSLEDTL